MPETTFCFADATADSAVSSIIDDSLRSLHINGSLLLRETYASPWSIAIPDTDKLATFLDVNPTVRVVAFHLVEFGHCGIMLEGGDEVLLKAGEIAICFGGNAHHLFQGKPSKAQSIETLLAGGPNIHRPHAMTESESTALLCGVFLLQHTAFNPLLAALPPLMHTTVSRPGELHNLSGVARLMTDEIDRNALAGGYVVERLLEVLCAEAVRAHIEAISPQERSWLRGIKDPVVGRAIAAIHSRPGDGWSVQQMAAEATMSPSRFAARFSESVGDSPMAYLTKWRMNLACRELLTTRLSIDRIATNIGYQSQAAFSRTFKKHIGLSPAAWRAREPR